MSIQHKNGVIVRCSDDAGICLVKDESSNQQFIFGYEKIHGYKGQMASEINLKAGRNVRIRLGEKDIVKAVELL